MVHLKAMDDENQAALCGEIETKGADISFTDICTVAEFWPVGGYGGPLVGSKHEATVAAHGAVCELQRKGVIIFVNVLLSSVYSTWKYCQDKGKPWQDCLSNITLVPTGRYKNYVIFGQSEQMQ